MHLRRVPRADLEKVAMLMVLLGHRQSDLDRFAEHAVGAMPLWMRVFRPSLAEGRATALVARLMRQGAQDLRSRFTGQEV